MKTVNNTFGVVFYIRKYKANNDGKAPIYARVTVNGSRFDLPGKTRRGLHCHRNN
jgi:hypothetical protein